jgi:hypothetical protein
MQFYATGDDRSSYRWDLGSRTDGQPIYSGKFENPPSGITSAQLEAMDGWIIHYFEYTTVSGADIVTSRKISTGIWSNRASLIYR